MLELQSAAEAPWVPHDLRVPRQDESLLAIPQLPEAIEYAQATHSALAGSSVNIQGRAVSHLRSWARTHVLQAACEYTSQLDGEAHTADPEATLFAGGHQPALFHVGVWVKNFAIAEMAARTGGTAINLIVDNDLLSRTRLRVPAGDRSAPRFELIPFDDDRAPLPWEEAEIQNPDLFDSFGERAAEHLRRYGLEPVLSQMWPAAIEQREQSGRLADCLTAARHALERSWGLNNLELPLSRLTTLYPFLWFASHILVQLPRFQEVHNAVLDEFRRVNRVRSRTHPVPALTAQDGWLEAPFWVWRAGDHQRKRPFAKQIGNELHVRDDKEVIARLRISPETEACCAVEDLRQLSSQGLRFRTRALTTTLFARICLADLFVHGIGGAKYDEMTDRIINRFYRLPAPPFLTMSATLHLPFAEPFDVGPEDERRLQALLRDLTFNSDRHLTPGVDANIDALLAERKRLVGEQQGAQTVGLSHRQRRERFRENYDRYRRLREISVRLEEFTAEQRRRAEAELADVRRHLEANRILQDRESSFALYPEEKLRTFMTSPRM